MNKPLSILCWLILLPYAQTSAQQLLNEWVNAQSGLGTERGVTITHDTAGNVYVGGHFAGGPADFDPGTDILPITSEGGLDGFIQKLNSDGNLVWVDQLGGAGNVFVQKIKTDATGNIYVSGYFTGSNDFDPGTATLIKSSISGSADVFVLKLASTGDLVWVKSFGGSLGDYLTSLDIDTLGNIYTTGYFMGTANFDPNGNSNFSSNGGQDIFIQKLDNNGNLLWVHSFGNSRSDQGRIVKVDNDNNVYLGGYFENSIDFDPGEGDATRTDNGSSDAFLQKLDQNGNLIWIKTFGGSNTDLVQDIDFDSQGNIFITGDFRVSVEFDPGNETSTATSNGDYDVYIEKLDSQGDFVWVRTFGSTSEDRPTGLSVDQNGDVIAVGYFQENMNLDPNGTSWWLENNGLNDFFISKLSSNGDLIWAGSAGSRQHDVIHGVSLSPDGNVLTTGYYQESVDFNLNTTSSLLITVDLGVDFFVHNLCYGLVWYADIDGDGYGNPEATQISCDQPAGYVSNNTDCNDELAASNPDGVDDPGSGVDGNCDGNYLWYIDCDSDGFGSTEIVSSTNPSPGAGESSNALDCDDKNVTINPDGEDDAPATGIDNNCDGLYLWYVDTDGDGFGSTETISSTNHIAGPGEADNNLDCDDTDATVYPGSAQLSKDCVLSIKLGGEQPYPNPTQNIIYLSNEITEGSWIQVYTLNGQKVLAQKVNSSHKISLNSLPSGTYFLKVENSQGLAMEWTVIKK